MNANEVLLALCQEELVQARQHEDQREKMTNFILVLAGALLAFAAQAGWRREHLFLTVPLALLGACGTAFSFKHYERNRYHNRIASFYRSALEWRVGVSINQLRDDAKKKHKEKFPLSYDWYLYQFWLIPPALVGLTAGAISIWLIACGK